MRIIIALLIAFFISACATDCERCTRTWTYKTYVLLANGTHLNETSYAGATENFSACGDDMIEASEKPSSTYSKIPDPNNSTRWNVTEGNANCNCN